MTEAFYDCPYFDSCQVNACPLASNYSKLENLKEDKLLFGYKKCKARKTTRITIAKKYGLKNEGMTKKEITRLKRRLAFLNEVQHNLEIKSELVIYKKEETSSNSII